jgi:hypothetical protein
MLLIVTAVLVVACSSTQEPAGGSNSTVSTSSTSATSRTTTSTAPSSFTGTLDEPTAAFFASFCSATTAVAAQATTDYPVVTGGATGTAQERQAAAKDAYGRLATAFGTASQQLSAGRPPSYLANAVSRYATAMKDASGAFAEAGAQIAAATVTDDASFETAATQTFTAVQARLSPIKDSAAAVQRAVVPALATAVRARFSECAGLP